MENVKRDVYTKDAYIQKTRVLTNCCYEGKGEQGVMENVERDVLINDAYIHKTRVLTNCHSAGRG